MPLVTLIGEKLAIEECEFILDQIMNAGTVN
jgi:hypothetical protein